MPKRNRPVFQKADRLTEISSETQAAFIRLIEKALLMALHERGFLTNFQLYESIGKCH